MSDSMLDASFRDPSGFLFRRAGELFRQVNVSYRDHYDRLLASGLLERLWADGLLIPHAEVDVPPVTPAAYRILRPEPVTFISYPYEWCFSQLRDAALTTLTIQRRALDCGMSLKDASAYNIQFHDGRPLLIDTLSFEIYREGRPWVAYRQFCQHFLAPLALMARRDVRLSQLLRIHIDGVPLDLCVRLLPWSARLDFGLFTHLYLHAAAQRRYAGSGSEVGHASEARPTRRVPRVSRRGLEGILDSLEGAVRRLRWKAGETEWADYYEFTNYTSEAQEAKARLVGELLKESAPSSVWDLGANTGRFSRLASERGIHTVAFDIDPAAVERNYLECRRGGERLILPLLLDLTNPSPALGWAHRERMSLYERGPADIILALALVHHLAISNNVPLPRLAEYIHGHGRHCVIEFVPKSDSKVRTLLATREDVFPDYHEEGFRAAFAPWFETLRSERIPGSERTLYLMRARKTASAGRE
jgi:hypothetical protein